MKKRLLSIILTLALCLSLLPMSALAAGTVTEVKIDGVDANGNIIKYNQSGFSRTGPVLQTTDRTLSGQYYIVQESMTIDGNLTVDGSKNGGLVLCEGVTLTVTGALIHTGGNAFYIYGQSNAGQNAGRLVIKNSLDNTGAAIRSTTYARLGISRGELEIHGGQSGKLVEGVELYSEGLIHKATLDDKTKLYREWTDNTSIAGSKLVIEYCDHPKANVKYTPYQDTHHHIKSCEQCGFNTSANSWKIATCGNDGTVGYVADSNKGHYKKCPCGNPVGDLIPHNGNGYVLTDHNQKHLAGCNECGYAKGEEAYHTYNDKGECTVCDFQPVATDSEETLYDDVNEALAAVANGKATFAKLETHASSKEVNAKITFNQDGKSAELQMNGYTLKNGQNATIEVENGTLTITGDANIIQNGTNESAANAVEVTGGTLDMQGAVTLTGGLKLSGDAKFATPLKAGDVLNGGVSVGGSYNSVNELLGDGLAFATKSGETTTLVDGSGKTITGNVTVVEHTHSYTNNGACACGAVCPHSNIDDATGKCADCNTVLKAAVNSTLYNDMAAAISAWKNDGGTLKLYVSGGTVSFDNASTKKPLSIDLNGHHINKDQAAISLNGVNLTIEDSREKKSSQGAFGAIVADSGSLTLENGGYLQGLKVPADSTATVMLKGGKVNALDCPKLVYTLLLDGYALMDGNLTVDPCGILTPGTQTYTIKNTQLKNITTTKSGNTTFGSQTIPFALSLGTDDSEIGKMSFEWYRIDRTTGTAVEIASFTKDETPVESVYTFNPDHVSISSDGWNGMTAGNTYNVICVVAGKKSNGAYCWQTALTGYTLTVGKAGIADADVQVTNKTYNGNPQSPDVTVKLGGKTLELNKDYTISGNSQTNAGDYTLTITGAGNYEGEKTGVAWKINPAELTFTVNAVSKPYDGTDTANADVTFSGLKNRDTLTKGTDYTVAAKFDNASAGENKSVTGTVMLNENVKNYVLNGNSISTTGTITKGKAPKPTTVLYIANNLKRTYTLDLTLPSLDNDKMEYGNYKFELGEIQVETAYYQVGTANINNGKLYIPIQAANSKNNETVGTIKVTLISDNIADCTWTIELRAVNRIIPTGTPIPSKTTLVYGEKLDTITLSGTMYDGDAEVAGKFQWDSSNTISAIGKQSVTWRFVPTDYTKYIDATGTVEIEVLKATPTGEPKYTAITTSGKKLSDAGLMVNENWPAGTVQWELATDTEVKANTAYKWVFTPTDSNNYNAIEGSVTLYHVSSSGGSSKPSYSVNTPSKTENGSVSLSTKNAVKGNTVTITVQPDSGYVLEKLVVTDKDGKQLVVTDQGNGKYTFVMPAGTVKVEASFTEQAKTPEFADVSAEAYYYEPVQWTLEQGITDGISEDLFGPNQPCTRGQIVTFLWRAAGSPAPKGTSSFADVPAESYYAQAVAWAVENSITNGTGEGTFSPDASCDRSQSVTFLFRALGGETAGDAAFSDVSAGSYYASAVAWAAEQGITNGTSSTTFSPNEICTRGQIVTFLYRGYQGK